MQSNMSGCKLMLAIAGGIVLGVLILCILFTVLDYMANPTNFRNSFMQGFCQNDPAACVTPTPYYYPLYPYHDTTPPPSYHPTPGCPAASCYATPTPEH